MSSHLYVYVGPYLSTANIPGALHELFRDDAFGDALALVKTPCGDFAWIPNVGRFGATYSQDSCNDWETSQAGELDAELLAQALERFKDRFAEQLTRLHVEYDIEPMAQFGVVPFLA